MKEIVKAESPKVEKHTFSEDRDSGCIGLDRIEKELLNMGDIKYREFSSALMPTVNADTVIGIRTPLLRAYAKKLINDGRSQYFIESLPHRYYEQNNLHAFIIEQAKDFDECIRQIEIFLPYIDNWATCDSLSPKCLRKNKPALLTKIRDWVTSPHEFTVRFALKCLMAHFLDDDFENSYLNIAASPKRDEYYINMMVAWFFATALAKQWDAAVPYIEKRKLSPWIHAKTIQKACESYRITDEQKTFLRTLK